MVYIAPPWELVYSRVLTQIDRLNMVGEVSAGLALCQCAMAR